MFEFDREDVQKILEDKDFLNELSYRLTAKVKPDIVDDMADKMADMLRNNFRFRHGILVNIMNDGEVRKRIADTVVAGIVDLPEIPRAYQITERREWHE